jgi:WD40 repeat protein
VRIIENPVATLDAKYEVSQLSFSVDGTYLLANEEFIWHVPTRTALILDEERKLGCSLSPDGKHLACIAQYGPALGLCGICVFTLKGAEMKQVFQHSVNTPDFSVKDPRRLFFNWSADGELILAGCDESWPIPPKAAAVFRLGRDEPIQYIDHPTEVVERKVGRGFGVRAAGILPDGNTVFTEYEGQGIFIYHLGSKELAHTLMVPGKPDSGGHIKVHGISTDGRILVTEQDEGYARHCVTFWDTTTWNSTWSMKSEEDRFVSFVPGVNRFATQKDGLAPTFTIRETATKAPVCSMDGELCYDRHGTCEQCFATNGSIAMVEVPVGEDATRMQIVNINDRAVLADIGQNDAHTLRCSAMTSDGRLVATGYPNGQVKLWDTTAGTEISYGSYMEAFGEQAVKNNVACAYRYHLAPPVTRELLDQLHEGMEIDEVWKLLGGKCHREKLSHGIESDKTTWYFETLEAYPAAEKGGRGSLAVPWG